MAGKYPFVDAAVYGSMVTQNGFTLTKNWSYQFTPFFDGVDPMDIEQHDNWNLLSVIGMSQATVSVQSTSRIDPTFGKSWNLRSVMNMIGEIHQPMHNIIRYSPEHPEGDDFGKLHSINVLGYKNVFDLFEDAYGQYRDLQYPLSSTTTLDKYVDAITKQFPKSELSKEIADDTKKNWSKDSYNIAVNFAYAEEDSDFLLNNIDDGKDIVNRQLALAGYRLAALVKHMMTAQISIYKPFEELEDSEIESRLRTAIKG
jgi:hypothetical protein